MIRYLELLITSWRLRTQASCDHPMKSSRGAFHRTAAFPVLDRVAHLCADEGRMAEVVPAGGEPIPGDAGRTVGTRDRDQTGRAHLAQRLRHRLLRRRDQGNQGSARPCCALGWARS